MEDAPTVTDISYKAANRLLGGGLCPEFLALTFTQKYTLVDIWFMEMLY